MTPAAPRVQHDLAVIGDGPAGLALAAAAHGRALRVAVVGSGRPWTATYGTWRDDVTGLPDECFASIVPSVVVHGHRRHDIARPYGVLANDALRAHLAAGLHILTSPAERIRHMAWGSRVITPDGHVDARIVVDARGRTTGGAATQSGFGVVVPTPPGAEPTLMDLRPAGTGPPTFCYAVPVGDGWLVEETILAARPAVAPESLAPRLAARIGQVPASVRTELVTIPMGGPLPSRRGLVPCFGAAVGYAHPATGFSVAASLRAAPRVADAIAAASRSPGRPDATRVWEAVWPAPLRRTRRLHDYGLAVLLRLDQDALATFFDTFFELPMDVWAPYLRIDASPRAVSRTMWSLARRLPRGMRRRLVVAPRAVAEC